MASGGHGERRASARCFCILALPPPYHAHAEQIDGPLGLDVLTLLEADVPENRIPSSSFTGDQIMAPTVTVSVRPTCDAS
ncbi:MAG: hypothetical protein J5I93_11410 [Pirellulaceae bacterium]|nr:hypothetical protein [Pirellulaceae bacterium]